MTAPLPPAPHAPGHTDIDPAGRTPEPSFGTDEEGEAPLPPPAVTPDKAAWVHVDGADDT